MKNREIYDSIIRQMEAGLERAVLRAISMHVGQINAITREKLAQALRQIGFGNGVTPVTFDRKIRHAISLLRKRGILICSSSGDEGYFIARDLEEYETFATVEYRGKIVDMSSTLSAMDAAAERQFGKRPPAGQPRLI